MSFARGEGGRTTRPKIIPGKRMSWTYAGPPVTLAGMSRRGMLLPVKRCAEGGFGFAWPVASRLNVASLVNSP